MYKAQWCNFFIAVLLITCKISKERTHVCRFSCYEGVFRVIKINSASSEKKVIEMYVSRSIHLRVIFPLYHFQLLVKHPKKELVFFVFLVFKRFLGQLKLIVLL